VPQKCHRYLLAYRDFSATRWLPILIANVPRTLQHNVYLHFEAWVQALARAVLYMYSTTLIPYEKAPELANEAAIIVRWFVVILWEEIFPFEVSKVLGFCIVYKLVSKEEGEENYWLMIKSVERAGERRREEPDTRGLTTHTGISSNHVGHKRSWALQAACRIQCFSRCE
jgi:hypothetical protein